MLNRRYFLIVLIITLCFTGCSAVTTNTTPEKGVNRSFEVRLYEEWLQKTGLSKFFHFEDITLPKNSTRAKDSPSIYNLRLSSKMLSRDFVDTFEIAHGLLLQEKLFFKFIHILNIPPNIGRITIDFSDRTIELRGTISGNIEVKLGNTIKHCLFSQKIQEADIEKLKKRFAIVQNSNILMAHKVLEQFFRNYFSQKGGIIEITKYETNENNQSLMSLNIRNLQKEIIKGERFWEKLQLSLVIIEHNSYLNIQCFISGWYAGGLMKPPSDKGFLDMEPHYAIYLQNYVGELFAKLQNL